MVVSGYFVPSQLSQNLACRIKDVAFSQTTQRTISAMMIERRAVMSKFSDRGRQTIIMPKMGRKIRRACWLG
jgi:hypothetical protein